MEFDHEPHQRTGITLISASEELIETLEDNQVKGISNFDLEVILIWYSGSTAEYDDVEICRLLSGASV